MRLVPEHEHGLTSGDGCLSIQHPLVGGAAEPKGDVLLLQDEGTVHQDIELSQQLEDVLADPDGGQVLIEVPGPAPDILQGELLPHLTDKG